MRTAFGDRMISRVELDGPGFLTVLAGFLLVLPGFLTDIMGALLLLPVTRRWIHAALRRAVARAERASRPPEVVDLDPDAVAAAAGGAHRAQAIHRTGLSEFAFLVAPKRLC